MKKKHLYLIVLLSVYILGYILCKFYFAQGMPMESYTAGWLYRNNFMFTWVLVIIVLLLNKPYTATFITIGCFVGIVIGDLLGGLIKNIRLLQLEELISSGVVVTEQQVAQAHHHYGILPIWFIVLILFVIIGIIIDKIKPSKA